MLTSSKKIEWMGVLLLCVIIDNVICGPMYYKKTDDDTYEQELVPISSTVIPLYTNNMNSTEVVKHHSMSLEEEGYRIAYLKHMLKKKKTDKDDDPDTLITLTKKYVPEKKTKTVSGHVAVVNSA